jgi:hypothetical protein
LEEGGYFFSAEIDDNTKLFLAQLTDAEAESAGLNECSGYFLYEKSAGAPGELNILAQVDTDEAAFALSRMLNMK